MTATAEPKAVPLSRVQRAVARRMSAAKAEIPEFVAEVEVDMTELERVRASRKREGGFVPSFNDFVVKAAAASLRQVPRVNSSFTDEGLLEHARVNVGVAVASGGALVVPTVFDADSKSVERIARDVKELVRKVREGSIRSEELADQTFTVSNLGMHGVRRFTAIINPPQAGILAAGAVEERVVPVDGAPALRPLMSAVLTSDHRVVYGADAAEFLAAFRTAMESPDRLLSGTGDLSEGM